MSALVAFLIKKIEGSFFQVELLIEYSDNPFKRTSSNTAWSFIVLKASFISTVVVNSVFMCHRQWSVVRIDLYRGSAMTPTHIYHLQYGSWPLVSEIIERNNLSFICSYGYTTDSSVSVCNCVFEQFYYYTSVGDSLLIRSYATFFLFLHASPSVLTPML